MKIHPKYKIRDEVMIAMSQSEPNSFTFKLIKLTVVKVHITVSDDKVIFHYTLSDGERYPSKAIISSTEDLTKVCEDLITDISTFIQ